MDRCAATNSFANATSESVGNMTSTTIRSVVSAPRDDPKNPKSAVVDMEYAGGVDPPVTLADVKGSGQFADLALVRQGRLSTMRVPDEFVKWVREQRPEAGITKLK